MIRKIFLSIFVFVACVAYNVTAQTPDPGLPGTHAVIKAEYNLGDTAYKPPSFAQKVEMIGSVHYPADLSSGPFPVLMFLHGRHETCYDIANPDNTGGYWPCPAGYTSITSYEGYDYLAEQMASHGYIVISISCNSINAFDDMSSDDGMQARAELMQHSLDLWNTYNTVGGAPFDSLFVGKLDMQNIGTMGHSRGGEGAIFNALYNQSLGSPYGIKAVLTLAPVDFYRHVLHNIPLLDVAPYCDGDVNDIEGLHFYDDSRYTDTADEAPKHTVLFMGANHNYFNTVWTPGSYIAGGYDDWNYIGGADVQCGEGAATRFDSTKQKAALNAYLSAFFRLYIGHEQAFAPILQVDDITPPVSSMLDTTNVFVSYHPGRSSRLDINRTDSIACLTTNTMGGTVTESMLAMTEICGNELTGMPDCYTTVYNDQKPHNGDAYDAGLAQMRMTWADTTAYYQNNIPAAYEDLTGYQSLLFRASVDFSASVSGANLDFSVQLTDSAGNTSSQDVNAYTHALFYQPGSTFYDVPKIIFNTVKIPLAGFTGIDITKVRNVTFVYNKSAAGAIVVSDISFEQSECGKFNASFSDSLLYGGLDWTTFAFANTTVSNPGDSLTYTWVFGDTTAGAYDTSTLANPIHSFTDEGTAYHTCLYVTNYRASGAVCIDTFCKTVTTGIEGVRQLITKPITIAPNPAIDHLHITGAANTDVLTLVDLYGQTILTTKLTTPDVYLPKNIATGIYYAVITTANGNIYKKILIAR